MPAKKVIVHVTSDVACPWCWVGKRAIETAAANLNTNKSSPAIDLELRWLPFQLNPGLPSGSSAKFFDLLAEKTGNPLLGEQWDSNPDMVPMNRSCAASNLPNIRFHFSKDTVAFNTYRAHTLLTYAGPIQKNWVAQNKMKEAMLRMTYGEGKNLDLIVNLTAAAQEAGIAGTTEEVERILGDATVKALLDKELKQYRHLDSFDGVPYFAFPDGQHFSGGQPVEVFEAVLSEAAGAATK